MRRRNFFRAALAAVAGLFGLGAAAEPYRGRRIVEKWFGGDRWERCRMWQLSTGDVFRLGDDRPGDIGTFRAIGGPVPCDWPDGAPGDWEIRADCEIDPATNEWVPVKPIPSRAAGK